MSQYVRPQKFSKTHSSGTYRVYQRCLPFVSVYSANFKVFSHRAGSDEVIITICCCAQCVSVYGSSLCWLVLKGTLERSYFSWTDFSSRWLWTTFQKAHSLCAFSYFTLTALTVQPKRQLKYLHKKLKKATEKTSNVTHVEDSRVSKGFIVKII